MTLPSWPPLTAMRRTGTSIRPDTPSLWGTLPAACEEAAQALEEGQFSGVVEADDGFYLILRKPVDLEAVAPDYFDALLQAAADSADISTTRTYADLDVSRFYDELIAARAELDASGGEVA